MGRSKRKKQRQRHLPVDQQKEYARENYLEQLEEAGRRIPKRYHTTTLDYFRYRDMGLNKYEAYKMATGRDGKKAAISLKEKEYKEFSLSDPEIDQLATQVVRGILEGKPRVKEVFSPKLGEAVQLKETPSFSNQLAAAQMVKDRTEPAVKVSKNLNLNVSVSPVDLSKYRTGPSKRENVEVVEANDE